MLREGERHYVVPRPAESAAASTCDRLHNNPGGPPRSRPAAALLQQFGLPLIIIRTDDAVPSAWHICTEKATWWRGEKKRRRGNSETVGPIVCGAHLRWGQERGEVRVCMCARKTGNDWGRVVRKTWIRDGDGKGGRAGRDGARFNRDGGPAKANILTGNGKQPALFAFTDEEINELHHANLMTLILSSVLHCHSLLGIFKFYTSPVNLKKLSLEQWRSYRREMRSVVHGILEGSCQVRSFRITYCWYCPFLFPTPLPLKRYKSNNLYTN